MSDFPATAGSSTSEPAPKARKRSIGEQVTDLGDRIGALPSRQRWAVIALAVLVGWFAVDELVWSWARSWSTESDRIAAALARGASRRGAAPSAELRRMVATYGAVLPPADAATGREELAAAINEVLRAKGISGYSYEARTGARLKDPDASVLGGAVDRIQAEVKFDTTAEALPEVIASLESHPAIELVSAMRVTRNEQTRKITVQATVESWVLSAGGRRSR
jgi:hypothetical protein